MVAGGAEAGDPRGDRRWLRRDARALDAQRRSDGGIATVRRRARRLRRRRGGRRARPRGARACRGPWRDDPGRAGRLRRHGRCVAHHAAGTGRDRCRPGRAPGAREGRPRPQPTSTTSTPTPPRRPRATSRSCRRSGRSSATRPARVPITANKSMLGHTLGAAGAIEAIATILTIRDGCIPPTINLAEPDPGAAGLDLTPNVAKSHEVRAARQQLVRVRRPEHGPHLHGPGG